MVPVVGSWIKVMMQEVARGGHVAKGNSCGAGPLFKRARGIRVLLLSPMTLGRRGNKARLSKTACPDKG